MRDDIVLSPALTADDVEGWDSMKQVDIIIAVEEHFDIKFTTKELDQLDCVGDLAVLIVAKVSR